MPEGKKNTAPLPAPVRDEDGYSAKTHLHQPVQETATVAATALLADAPEGALPSEVRPEIVTWEKLCEAIQASGKAYNMEMIQKAYELANNAHNGVCRRSGEPYICHPLAVARLVLDLGMDSESIAAALLHDVVEDTPTTLDDLKAAFGEEVALLVDGVTKLTKIQFSNIEELQAENLRKMLLAMSRDVRVMIIKLCDRLHNMRTGDAWPEQKRRDKARETMEVYAPIANRLGILNVKEELEDRSLHYLDPVGYAEISRMLSERAGEEFLIKVSGVIERRLVESGIEGATIKRRVKSIYGIYRKTIICIGFVVSAVSTTSSGALEGLGKGVPSLVISLCRYVVFILPLAAVLCGRLGPDGVWHAFWITEVLTALVAYPVYHRAAARH